MDEWKDITVSVSKQGSIEMTYEPEGYDEEDRELTIIGLNLEEAEYLIDELTTALERHKSRKNRRQQ